jgi:predicted oxidoreductase
LFQHAALFDGTLDHLYRNRVAVMAWSPMGGGRLLDETTQEGNSLREQARALLQKYNATLSQLLLAWLLKHPAGIFPVVGTGKPERLTESARAISIDLERQDWFEMLRWAKGTDVP